MIGFEEVIRRVEGEIARASQRKDPMGFFMCVYLHVICKFRELRDDGAFEDATRFEEVSGGVSRRYLEILDGTARPVPRSWAAALAAAQLTRYNLLQHIFISANAHLNVDLGIAAGIALKPAGLPGYRKDYLIGTRAIEEVIGLLYSDLGQIWPEVAAIDLLLRRYDNELIGWNLQRAYDYSWDVAKRIAPLSGKDLQDAIQDVDHRAARLAQDITDPQFLPLRLALWWLRLRQPEDPREIMRILMAHHVHHPRADALTILQPISTP